MTRARNILRFLPAIVIAGIVFYFSSLPGEETPVSRLTYDDKFLHITVWAGLTFFTYFALGSKRPVWLVGGICLAYGVFDELHQAAVRATSVNDVYDLVADLIGVVLGVIAWKLWERILNGRDAAPA